MKSNCRRLTFMIHTVYLNGPPHRHSNVREECVINTTPLYTVCLVLFYLFLFVYFFLFTRLTVMTCHWCIPIHLPIHYTLFITYIYYSKAWDSISWFLFRNKFIWEITWCSNSHIVLKTKKKKKAVHISISCLVPKHCWPFSSSPIISSTLTFCVNLGHAVL